MANELIVNQCKAHRRATGEQCRRSAIRGGTVCPSHGGRAPQIKRKAMQRLEAAADQVMAALIRIATDERYKPADRVQACKDLLDRAGYGVTHRFAVEASVDPDLIEMITDARARMAEEERAEYAARALPALTDVADAEIVDDSLAFVERW